MLRTPALALVLALFVPLHNAVAATTPTPVVEFYNAALDHYFITWVPDEIAKLDAGTQIKGWTRTGKSLQTFTGTQGGTSPVCRYYIPPGLGDSHFFGRGSIECVATGINNPSFVNEDPVFMHMFLPTAGTCPIGTTNVYRVFSNRPDANHRYMTETAVRDEMVAKGWLAEGDGPDLVVMCAPVDPGAVAAFNPTTNTTLGGVVQFTSVTIPAGVTVTVTSELAILASGPVNIAGTLIGDCKPTSITTTDTFTSTGTIDNGCTALPDGTAPALALVADGGYSVGGTMASSGDVMLTNHLAAAQTAIFGADGRVVASPNSSPSSRSTKVGPYACTSPAGAQFIARPFNARDGADGGARGGDGKRGRNWVLWCDRDGNGRIESTSVFGQGGGYGGSANHTSATSANATGGDGGAGGALRVFVTGDLDFFGGNMFQTGRGGNSGFAIATSTQNPALPAAPPATATSGKGGDGGLITIQSLKSITVNGAITLDIGNGGHSLYASALAADGLNSTVSKPAQAGGAAKAVSGDGGKLPPRTFTAAGAVTGAGNVTIIGAAAGDSGYAEAIAGRGGDGIVVENKHGGAGGTVNGAPGRGGNAELRNLAGALVANGGNSGDAFLEGGNGGHGYNDCAVPVTEGGNGGNGGAVSGGGRFGGTGLANGTDGGTFQEALANGGNGGNGVGPGKRGETGVNNVFAARGTVSVPPVFTPGNAGRGCRFAAKVVVLSDPSPPHESFVNYTSTSVLDALVNNDASTIRISGVAGGTWITVNGTYNKTTGNFSATGVGSAAGYPNVSSNFVGKVNFSTGQITGDVTLGGGEVGLPSHPVSYTVTATVTGVAP